MRIPTRPWRGNGLGQIPFLDSNPFPNILPSPASEAAANPAWQPTQDALHLPDLTHRLIAGGSAAAILIGMTLLSRNDA